MKVPLRATSAFRPRAAPAWPPRPRGKCVGAALLGLCLAAAVVPAVVPAVAAERSEVLDVPGLGPERVIFDGPAAPKGAVVLLPGGAGRLGIGPNGALAQGDNFLVRTRASWIARGFAYALPDAPAGLTNLKGERLSTTYAGAIGAIADRLRILHGVPVWLVGTSQGAIAAANAAVRLGKKAAGLVMISPVSARGASGETVFDAPLAEISVPALVVVNKQDGCPTSPPADGPRLLAALARARPSALLGFDSGDGRGNACGPLSPHGYLGIEDVVLGRIAGWMLRAVPPG